ncbi:hypothetical protein [Streptomyces griseorubiginosus]|uniref:hypothetical protein n=1 Tax=Streptomyces griseorubiginosus TaxID=67304 RepID=UPI0036E62BA8
MTAQITKPSAQEAETGPSSQLRSYMAAVSALEHMLSTSPAMPDTVDVRVYSFAPNSPSLHLHCASVADVEAIGRHFAATVSSLPHRTDPDSRLYTSAVGEFRGVPFTAWILTDSAVAA